MVIFVEELKRSEEATVEGLGERENGKGGKKSSLRKKQRLR